MRKVIAAAFVSLDGVMQAPGGPEEDPTRGFQHGGWTFHYWDNVMEQAMGETFNTPYDLLLGRKTYDIFAAHWPSLEGDPTADAFNRAKKYVATRSLEPLGWQNSVALHDAASPSALRAGPTMCAVDPARRARGYATGADWAPWSLRTGDEGLNPLTAR